MNAPPLQMMRIRAILRDVRDQHYTPEQGLELIGQTLGFEVPRHLVGDQGFWRGDPAVAKPEAPE